MGNRARGLTLLFVACLLALVPHPGPCAPPAGVDPAYVALETLIRETPLESMDEIWLLDRVYRPHAAPQRYLKQILGAPELATKNARMARLRQAYDLAFWIDLARRRGWVIELTNQGKSREHLSDLDQTGWIIAGPEANRPKNFAEVEHLWAEYHRGHGIQPGQPDMTLFNGDQFLPDAKNARQGSAEFITQVTGTVLALRQNAEAYYVPGANKDQTHNRALSEGRTLHIAWDFEENWAVINGKPFDLDAFRAGKIDLTYLKASDIANRYQGVHADAPWRNALGNLAQNTEKFVTHPDDPIARQKYGNRIIDGAFGRILGVTQKDGVGGTQTYYAVHASQADPATKRTFKETFIRQLYGEDLHRNRVDELIKLFDTSMDIEADKDLRQVQYDPRKYYGPYLDEAAANLRRREPDLKGEALHARALDEAERLFVQKQLQAYAEGASKVMAHMVKHDFGPEGRLVNRTEFIGSKADYEAMVKRQAERQVEVALLFEIVERIDEPGLRKRLRNEMIDSAGTSHELRRLFSQFADLGQAGRQAIDDWLRASSEGGKLAKPADFYTRIGDDVKRVVGDLDQAAAKGPREVALSRTRAAVATTLGPRQASRRDQALQFLQTAKGMGGEFAQNYWNEFKDGLNFFFYADTGINLIRSYEQGCLNGGLHGSDCGWRIAHDAASNFFWGLPIIETYGTAASSMLSINQGDASGFFSLAIALATRIGADTGIVPLYGIYKLADGVYEISYAYIVDLLNNDVLQQALKSNPTGQERGLRCDIEDKTFRADTPRFPLFHGEVDSRDDDTGPVRIAVPADHWLKHDRARAEATVRAEYGGAINHLLLSRKLKAHSPQWVEAERQLVTRFTCELPYYQRMARLYERLSPRLERYIAQARAEGRDIEDRSFEAMEACERREYRERAKQRALAAAKSPEAMREWALKEAAMESPISLCLPRGIEAASAVLRPFMNRQIKDWFEQQPDGFRAQFSTTFEAATEGNRVVEQVRGIGRWFDRVVLGRDPAQNNREALLRELTDILIREYVLSQYTHEQRAAFNQDMAVKMAALAANVQMAERLLRAVVAGQRELGASFASQVAKTAAQVHTQPVTPIAATLKLRLPDYPVRLGRDLPLDANVRGEYPRGGPQAAPAWQVRYRIRLHDTVREGPPDGLIITPEVARDLQVEDHAIYALKATVVAQLIDGDGQVQAEDQGDISLFDIRPRPGRASESPAAPATPVDVSDLLDRLRALEPRAEEAASTARQRCAEAGRQALLAEAEIKTLNTLIGALDADTRSRAVWLERATRQAQDSQRLAQAAYAAAQAIGDARKRADFAADEACEGLTRIQSAPRDSDRQQAQRAIAAAVQRCKAELATINQQEKLAHNAAQDCTRLRQQLPPPPADNSEAPTVKLDASVARAGARRTGGRTAQAEARAQLELTRQAGTSAQALVDEARRRLQADGDRTRATQQLSEMDAIVVRMARTRHAAEGCPEQVDAALLRAEQAAQASAESMRMARARAEQITRQIREAAPVKHAEAECRSARASADSASLLAQSARVMCQDGATCQAIAEDLVRQPQGVKVPSVIGLGLEAAQARLSQSGLKVAGIQVSQPAQAIHQEGTVQSQSPGPGSNIARDGGVTLRVWGPPDRNALLAATDCSALPGSVAAWNPQLNLPTCVCPGGHVLRPDGGACIDCAAYEAHFAAAINGGQFMEAAGLLAQTRDCPWHGRAAAALQQAQDDQQRQGRFALECLQLETQILAALNAKNLSQAQALLAEARQRQCPMDPSTPDYVRRAENLQRQPPPVAMPWPVPPPGPSEPVRQVRCNDTAKQGGNTPETLVVDLGRMQGTFRFDFDMFGVPDRMLVQYGGGTFDTGCVGNNQGAGRGKGAVDLHFYGSSQVTVRVQPACEGKSTQWKFTVHCPR
ncbi:MAG: PASTA domain-containing protein [Pseudomonadota bacterium]